MKTEDITKSSGPSAADWAVLRQSSPEDFDGHTGFERMTPTERLRWLDQAAEFVSKQNAAARCRETNGALVSGGDA